MAFHNNHNRLMTYSYPSSFFLIVVLLLLVVGVPNKVVVFVQANNPNGQTPWSLRDSNIQSHVQKWKKNPDEAAREWGPIGTWDLRNVTSLRNLFSFDGTFNDDISGWNVSGVTDFSSVFWEAASFNGDLGRWDVRNAQTMACMFCGASKYKGVGLEQWKDKLGKVEDMYNMFQGTAIGVTPLEKEAGMTGVDLSEWRVESVTNFRTMFMDTPYYDQQLCWNVSLVARATDMFNNSGGACFKPKCVLREIAIDAGCSGASALLPLSLSSSWMVSWILIMMGVTTGLVSLVW